MAETTHCHHEDDFDDWDDDGCSACGGGGWEIVCPDDLCHGQGWCMHGDGDRPCPQCNPHGIDRPYPEDLPKYALDNGWTPARPTPPDTPTEDT